MTNEEQTWPTCPCCGYDGATNVLGTLGNLTHVRCRSCGVVYTDQPCLVDPDTDGVTLWDCPCNECEALRREGSV